MDSIFPLGRVSNEPGAAQDAIVAETGLTLAQPP